MRRWEPDTGIGAAATRPMASARCARGASGDKRKPSARWSAAGDDGCTTVEAIDLQTMVQLSDSPQVREVADDAERRLCAALSTLEDVRPATD